MHYSHITADGRDGGNCREGAERSTEDEGGEVSLSKAADRSIERVIGGQDEVTEVSRNSLRYSSNPDRSGSQCFC